MGCHGQLDGLGCHWELWAMVGGGMTPREALKAGTLDGAHGIGMDRDWARSSPESWLISWYWTESARRHPQHREGPLRDEERAAV